MGYFPPDELSQAQQNTTNREMRRQYRTSADPRTAAGIADLMASYPNLRPGTALALGKAGVPAKSPVARAAAEAEVKREKKKDRGFDFGDFITGAAGKAAGAIGDVADTAYDVVKGVSRGAAMGPLAIGQTFQGALRESTSDGDIQGSEWLLGLPHLAKGFRQTDLYAANQEVQSKGGYAGLVTGSTDVDYGSGFFPGGNVGRTAGATRTAASGSTRVGGKLPTIGRYAAQQVFEPGSRSFGVLSGLIDATVSLGSDPTTFVGGGARQGIEASRNLAGSAGRTAAVVARDAVPDAVDEATLDVATIARRRAIQSSRDEGLLSTLDADEALRAAGGLDGSARKTVLPERVAEWLDSKQGLRLREYLREETSFERMRQVTKGKVDVKTLVALTDARSDGEVLDILAPQLGIQVRQKFGVSASAVRAAHGGNDLLARRVGGSRTRLGAMVPGTHMDLENADVAVETTERFLQNVNGVRNLGQDRMAYWTERMARSETRNARFATTSEMLDEVRDRLLDDAVGPKGKPMPDTVKKSLTRMYEDYDQSLRRYAIDEIGDNAIVPGAIIDGTGKALPTPHLYGEYVNGSVPLPDARELRRATSNVVNLVTKARLRPGYDAINTIADFQNQQVFKPLVLLRGAWTLRVVGEEQIRLAASGMTSAFAHPLSHIALAMGKKGGRDLNDTPFAEAESFQQAMSRGASGFKDDGKLVRTRHRIVIDRSSDKFAEALLDEMGKLSNDAVMRRVLNGLQAGDEVPTGGLSGMDAVKDWFFNGSGQKYRREMLDADRDGDRSFLARKVADDGSINSSDGYIDSLMERVKTVSGGDQRLMDAIRSGQINGKPLYMKDNNGQWRVGRDALKDLSDLIADGTGPQKIPADLLVHAKGNAGSKVLAGYDKGVEVLFDVLMTKPTNFLSRSPAFQQSYWKRNSELIEFMDAETQAQAIRVARESGLSAKMIDRMEKVAKRGSGELNVAEADMISKAFALDATRKLLYDMHERSQFFDITRAIFPFGEAWKEVATTWARIGVVENPMALRRGQQIITGLRSADLDGDGEGFFYTDPQTGEEVFNLPGSQQLNKWVTGVAAPLQATAKGLNIFSTSVIPGVGPIVQMPAGKILPDRPEWDAVRKLVMPFGERNTDGGILESYFPAWAQKWRTAMGKGGAEQDRLFANSVTDAAAYLASTGEYEYNSVADQERLLKDAKSAAQKLWFIRGAAQFFAPSPPSPEFVAQDKTGQGVYMARMVEEFYNMRNDKTQDPSTATERFIEKFGEDAFLTTISGSTGGGAPTEALYDFVRTNPDSVARHRDVYGYFMKPGGEFSQDAYRYQLRSGERKPKSPEQAVKEANQRLGEAVYRQAQSKVRQDEKGRPNPTEEEGAWLREVKAAIKDEFVGYGETTFDPTQAKKTVDKVRRALEDPVLGKTEAGKAAAIYFEERESAIRIAQERGLAGFDRSPKTEDIRTALRTVGADLIEQYPDFREMYERVFEREMVED